MNTKTNSYSLIAGILFLITLFLNVIENAINCIENDKIILLINILLIVYCLFLSRIKYEKGLSILILGLHLLIRGIRLISNFSNYFDIINYNYMLFIAHYLWSFLGALFIVFLFLFMIIARINTNKPVKIIGYCLLIGYAVVIIVRDFYFGLSYFQRFQYNDVLNDLLYYVYYLAYFFAMFILWKFVISPKKHPQPPEPTLEEKLILLKQRFDNGEITEDSYNQHKKEILDKM